MYKYWSFNLRKSDVTITDLHTYKIKTYKPTTSSLRFVKQINYKTYFGAIRFFPYSYFQYKYGKFKKLKLFTFGLKRKYGRNGRITVFHKGGGCKRDYRFIYRKPFSLALVLGFEYDPYRSAILMRVYNWKTKLNFYQIAPQHIKRGDIITFDLNHFNLKLGHSSFLKNIPLGTTIYNINFTSKLNTYCSRAAGTFSQIIQKTNKYCLLKLSSGEFRYFTSNSIGSYGKVSNNKHKLIVLGKAGRSRWLNKRPTVRGVAMNPIDHPHGGGQGKTSSGRPPVTPWGKLTKGVKTRNKKKFSLILKKK